MRARLAGIILIVNVIIINRSVTMGTDKSKTHTHTRRGMKTPGGESCSSDCRMDIEAEKSVFM